MFPQLGKGVFFSPLGAIKLRQLPASLRALFNIPAHTDKQLQQFKSLTLYTLVALMAHKEFVSKVRVTLQNHVTPKLWEIM